MTRGLYTALALSLMSTACGSSNPASAPKASPPGGEGGAPQAAAADGAIAVEELDLDEGTFTVAPGQEVTYCVKLPMPAKFANRELAILNMDTDVPLPTHHYFMTYSTQSVSGTKPVPCSGTSGVLEQSVAGQLEASSGVLGTKFLFGAGVGQNHIAGRDGYGRVIEANGSFITNHHVINATANPVTLYAKFKLYVADVATVQHPVRTLICANSGAIDVPPHQAATYSSTCTVPFDLDVVTVAGHAHARLTMFTAQVYSGSTAPSGSDDAAAGDDAAAAEDGSTQGPPPFYTNVNWDSPTVDTFAGGPPLHLTAGQGLTFTCNYYNTTDTDVVAGFNANNEMCAFFMTYAYPADVTHKSPPPLYGTGAGSAPFMATDSTNINFFF
jgi:hypothetical protein